MSLVKKPEKFIEAPPNRIVFRGPPEMPFSEQPGDISRVDKPVGDGFFSDGKPRLRIHAPSRAEERARAEETGAKERQLRRDARELGSELDRAIEERSL